MLGKGTQLGRENGLPISSSPTPGVFGEGGHRLAQFGCLIGQAHSEKRAGHDQRLRLVMAEFISTWAGPG